MTTRAEKFAANAKRNRAAEHRGVGEKKPPPGQKLAKAAAKGKRPDGGKAASESMGDFGKGQKRM